MIVPVTCMEMDRETLDIHVSCMQNQRHWSVCVCVDNYLDHRDQRKRPQQKRFIWYSVFFSFEEAGLITKSVSLFFLCGVWAFQLPLFCLPLRLWLGQILMCEQCNKNNVLMHKSVNAQHKRWHELILPPTRPNINHNCVLLHIKNRLYVSAVPAHLLQYLC